LKEICAGWAGDEQLRFIQMIQKKKLQAKRGVSKGMDESEALPLQWNVEAIFEDNGQLRADWRDTYWSFIHSGCDRGALCHEYVRGLQWILDYYTGRPIDQQWLFPAWIPPLWGDFAGVEIGRSLEIEACGTAPIQPQEQLAMVLPVESWGLIRDRRLRSAPRVAPQFWPRQFGFFSFGRTWLWQCEARVPVLMVERLRACVADKV
jgi:5'-3' exonuclease